MLQKQLNRSSWKAVDVSLTADNFPKAGSIVKLILKKIAYNGRKVILPKVCWRTSKFYMTYITQVTKFLMYCQQKVN